MPNIRILVVDDDEGFIRIIKLRLESKGYRVSYSYEGDKALDKALADSPDAIILDVNMQPVNGVDVYKALRKNSGTKDIPVLFLSEKAEDADLLRRMGISGEKFLTKPYEPNELSTAIDAMLKSPSAEHMREKVSLAEAMTKEKEYSLCKLLVSKGVIAEDKMKNFLDKREKGGSPIVKDLVSLGLAEEKAILIAVSASYGLPYFNLKDIIVEQDAVSRIPVKYAWYYKMMPIKIEGDRVLCAISDPLNMANAMDDIIVHLNQRLRLVLSSESQITELINKYYGIGSETVGNILSEKEDRAEDISLTGLEREDIAKLAENSSVIKLVNQILVDAQDKNATDIHIEPYQGKVKLRYRIDGVLYDAKVPAEITRFLMAIISRIKIMSNLNIVERRLPQDGRARVKIKDDMFDLRVSTLPSAFGESIAIRILPTKMLFSLQALGLSERDMNIFKDLIRRPYGIIFVTGPTGSGKTTTLYAALTNVKEENPGAKIITIEDPIEYELEGVTQLQVNPEINFTFARGLRSMLRHDPNLMMIGEVRDAETAETAIQMALTGHLLFSTLHTNDAASGITRLLDIGIEPYLLSSSIEALIAQRLVRVICEKCKYEVPKNEETSAQISQIREKIISISKYRRSDPGNQYENLRANKPASATWLRTGELCYKGKGCEACNFTGYKGRTAIYEILLITEEIKKLIQSKASSYEITQRAISEGMRTLYQCGFDKVVNGITTFEEILRVAKEEIIE